ncbi:MAG: IclR family transcriptional regulator [Steroidobacteraceae bacterium]
MNSLRRMLDLLTLFKQDQAVVDVEDICKQFGYAPASAYRYVRELSRAGLLVRLPGGYALGPRIIELDLQMRDYDPILSTSRDLIADLSDQTGLNALLSELYGDTVINIHQAGRDIEHLSYGRGRTMPLFRGATSRVILAHLPASRLRKLFEEQVQEVELQRLGASWKEFSKAMLRIRKAGYCSSRSELDVDKAGLAAPIFDESQRVLGSLTLIGSVQRLSAFNPDYLAGVTIRAAAEISSRIGGSGSPVQSLRR